MTQKSKTGRASKNGKTSARGSSSAPAKRRRGRPTKQETQARAAEYVQFEGERLIHRYGNRRFYDLAAKKPITMEELADLVRRGEMVRVIDVDSGNEDITRRVLTQIILEQPTQNNLSLLPVEFLRKLIASDEKTAKWIDSYLKAGAEVLDRSVRQGIDIATAIQQNLRHMTGLTMPWQPTGKPETPPEQLAELEALKRQLETYLKAVGKR